MLAYRQTLERSKTIFAFQRKAFCAGQRGFPPVMHKIAGVHRRRQTVPDCIACGAEQHRTRICGNAVFIKQAADKGGRNFSHEEILPFYWRGYSRRFQL